MTDKTTENSIEQLDRLIEALDHQLLEDNTVGEEKKVVFHNTDTALIRLYLDAIRLRASICQGISLENDEAEQVAAPRRRWIMNRSGMYKLELTRIHL